MLESDRKMFPQNLHMQFHGREMHTLCFVSENSQVGVNVEENLFDRSSWIATGCEDGTVRLTRYADCHRLYVTILDLYPLITYLCPLECKPS